MIQGHPLLTYMPLLTTEAFFSSKDMKKKFGVDMYVQKIVATPHFYILACSSNSCAEKMVYAEHPVDDLLDLSVDTTIGNMTVRHPSIFSHLSSGDFF